MQAINQTRNDRDARYFFVEGQLRPNNITNQNILNAALFVNREDYLPALLRSIAYVDTSLSVGEGRALLSPFCLVRLINLLTPQPGEKYLVLGCATGYSLAFLKELGVQAYGVDVNQDFCDRAAATLREEYNIVDHIKCGLLDQGWQDNAPYDGILIEGSAEIMPTQLFDQLRVGGKLAVIMKKTPEIGRGGVWIKTDKSVTFAPVFDCNGPLLSGFEKKHRFVL